MSSYNIHIRHERVTLCCECLIFDVLHFQLINIFQPEIGLSINTSVILLNDKYRKVYEHFIK